MKWLSSLFTSRLNCTSWRSLSVLWLITRVRFNLKFSRNVSLQLWQFSKKATSTTLLFQFDFNIFIISHSYTFITCSLQDIIIVILIIYYENKLTGQAMIKLKKCIKMDIDEISRLKASMILFFIKLIIRLMLSAN